MPWTHLSDVHPMARKPHRCYLCGLEIPLGERHVKRTGLDEGGPSAIRMHIFCESRTREWDEDDWIAHDARGFHNARA